MVKRIFVNRFLFFLFNIFFIFTQACQLPAYSAVYDVQDFGMSLGEATQRLVLNQDQDQGQEQYHFSLDIKSSIAFYQDEIIQTSEGFIQDNKIFPEHYFSHEDHKNKTEDILFDQKLLMADAKKDEQKTKVIFPKGTGDVLSMQIALREFFILNSNQRKFSYDLIKSNKVQTYEFNLINKEDLNTPLGKISSIKLERTHGSQIEDYWLAPEYGYLLLKSSQRNKGNLGVVLTLKSYQINQGCLVI